MRIRCSFTLEPEQHQSHSHAVERLRQWQQREKSLEGETQAQQARRNAFHRDLYLSGLFLHQLSPQLTAQLSARLGEPGAEAALQQCLSSAGVGASAEGGLSDGQWQQLTTMLKTAMAAPKPEHNQELAPLSKQLTQMEERLADFPNLQPPSTDFSELQAQLAELAQGQQALMTQLESVSGAQSADLSTPLLQLNQGQEKLLAQIKGLKGQLGGSSEPEKAETPNLETQLQKASRVKAKGIW